MKSFLKVFHLPLKKAVVYAYQGDHTQKFEKAKLAQKHAKYEQKRAKS